MNGVEIMDIIKIENAYENNLKHIYLDIPINKWTCFIGPSGSGKSSLVYDTLFAECQREFLDSLVSNQYGQRLLEKAKVDNIINLKLKEGGSSITQQLSKNIFLDQKTELERKIKELFYAIELEKRYSKDDILELYVNTSYFGAGYYGIGPATKGYYDKTPEKLNLNEIAFLAGVPNAPSVYNPYEHYELALQRRNIVLRKMVYNGDITQEEALSVYNEKLNVKERNND